MTDSNISGDSGNTTPNASNAKVPQKRVAVEAHQAAHEAQLSLEVDEVVEVIGDVDDDWVEIRNKTGNVGVVPKMCIDL